jgi:hypothetical protein
MQVVRSGVPGVLPVAALAAVPGLGLPGSHGAASGRVVRDTGADPVREHTLGFVPRAGRRN